MSSSPVVSTPGHEAQDPPRPSQGAQQTPAGVSSPTPPSQLFQGHCLGPIDPKGFLQGDWKDPRPPVPGGEDPYGEEKVDGRGGRQWGEKSSHHCLQYSPQLHPQFQVEGYEGCGCAEVGSPCEGWTPPCVRWSESLRQLLEDPIGVRMFQQYLKSECGSCESLHFWFACNGLKKADDYSQLVTIIWKKFIRNYAVKVSPKTYTEINDKVNSKRNIDKNIFDKAQHEVEEEIARTTYPNFLESDIYLHHLSAQQTGGAESPKVSDSSPPIPSGGGVGVLPTLHEDFELQGGGHAEATHMRLTQGALAATVRQRANVDRRKTEACDGQYLHGSYNVPVNPYHATYSSCHVVSRQDSELQSLSSEAPTDDTLSCTDSSVDGMPLGLGRPMNPKYMKRHYHKMRENARQNRELAMGGLMAHGGMGLLPGPSNSASIASNHPPSSGGHSFPFLPRTHRIRKESIPNMKPEEFALLLIEKLEMVKRDQEAQEKMQQSFKKIQEGDDVSDEYRRQHAFNSLPPALLLDKLVQKISIEETDKSQSILDEHVSRVWEDSNNESPARSPGTPRAKSPPRRVPPSCRSQHPNKGMVLGGLSHPSMYPGHHLHQPPNPYNTKTSSHHSRRKDRGPDVYSIFSSDSGNVPDFYDGHLLPKSRSMPDYMENYAGGSSDGGSSGRRQGSSSRRSGSRRPPAELTDSGVSVVSDSSMAPSASSTDRRSSSKKGSSSSVMGTGPRSGSLERGHTSWGPGAPPGFEQREGGMHSASGCLYEDPKKKTRTGMSSHGGRTCHSGHGEGLPGSNGSTLKKSRAPRHSAPGSGISSSVGETSGSSSSCSQQIQQQGGQQSQQGSSSSSVVQSVAESTTIVYNFYDDSVPFVTKVPTRPITLKRFKQHLPKKGNYRFFFKKQCKEFGVIQEEITDDNEILPLYEGRVFAQVRKAD